MDGMKASRGLTLIEILASMVIGGIALSAYMQAVKPTIANNKAGKKHIDITGALSEVLDSAMTQPVATLDVMNNLVFKSRQGVDVRLYVTSISQGEADAVLSGMDISRLRKLKVRAEIDTTRSLSTTVSNYQENSNGKCYTQ